MNILASVEEWVKKNFQWISGGLRKLRDLKEVAMSITPTLELAKKRVLERRVSYQGVFFAWNRDLKRPKVPT